MTAGQTLREIRATPATRAGRVDHVGRLILATRGISVAAVDDPPVPDPLLESLERFPVKEQIAEPNDPSLSNEQVGKFLRLCLDETGLRRDLGVRRRFEPGLENRSLEPRFCCFVFGCQSASP